MHPKDADGMANSVDPDQKQSDLGLHCLLGPICPNTKNLYGNMENRTSQKIFHCVKMAKQQEVVPIHLRKWYAQGVPRDKLDST